MANLNAKKTPPQHWHMPRPILRRLIMMIVVQIQKSKLLRALSVLFLAAYSARKCPETVRVQKGLSLVQS